MARRIPAAHGHAGGKDRQVHADGGTGTRAGAPAPPPAPAGGGRGPPSAGRLATGRAAPAGGGLAPRLIATGSMSPRPTPTPDSPTGRGPRLHAPPTIGAPGVGPHAVAGHPRRRPQAPRHEAAQQRLLRLRGGDTHHRAAGRAIGPVPQTPEGDWASASSWREEWQRRLSHIRCWIWQRDSCTKCSGCSCPGTSQHHQPSQRFPPRVPSTGWSFTSSWRGCLRTGRVSGWAPPTPASLTASGRGQPAAPAGGTTSRWARGPA